MVPSLTQCAVCNVPANLKCGGCKNVVYCSKDHQKAHWKKGHKQNCKCVELKVNNLLGRHLVATRDIKQGEIIMREKPLVIGPKVNSFPVCLGCCKTLELQSGDKNYYKCSHCKYPMCGASCEKLKDHQLECNLMAGKKFNAKIDYTGEKKRETHYCTILPLRCLLLEKKNPEGFQKLLDLESHLDKRIDTPIYRILRANFTTFFKTILEMDADINKILTMAAISDTNAFEIQLPHRYIKIRGIYPMAAMIAHNCTPNTRHVFDNNLEMIVIGSVDIKKGETITASYGQSLQGTIQRREHLKMFKCFDCTCERCKDPTEFGTYVGAISCTHCRNDKISSTDPLNNLANWKCNSCGYEIAAKTIISGNKDLIREISNLNKSSPKEFEMFLLKYADTLHATNTHVLQIKYALTQLYGNVPGFFLHELNDAGLARKIQLCHDLIDVADILEPGYSSFRGNLLLDLQSVMAVQTKREFHKGLITKQAAQENLMQAMQYLQEAVNILKIDPAMESILEERVTKLSQEMNID